MPFTLQVTALVDPETLGMNCRLVPSRTVAEVGEIAMVTLEELLLLHPATARLMTSGKPNQPNRAFMLRSPISMPFLARRGARWSLIQNVRLTVKRKVEVGSKKLIR
jgi:hypothetical protein